MPKLDSIAAFRTAHSGKTSPLNQGPVIIFGADCCHIPKPESKNDGANAPENRCQQYGRYRVPRPRTPLPGQRTQCTRCRGAQHERPGSAGATLLCSLSALQLPLGEDKIPPFSGGSIEFRQTGQ